MISDTPKWWILLTFIRGFHQKRDTFNVGLVCLIISLTFNVKLRISLLLWFTTFLLKVFVGRFVPRKEREIELGEKAKRFTNVYVKNFNEAMTEEDLQKMFEKFGKITSLKVSSPFMSHFKGDRIYIYPEWIVKLFSYLMLFWFMIRTFAVSISVVPLHAWNIHFCNTAIWNKSHQPMLPFPWSTWSRRWMTNITPRYYVYLLNCNMFNQCDIYLP